MTGAARDGRPTAGLDPLRRLRVLASAAAHAGCVERHFDVPFDTLWSLVSDLERELPHLLPEVRSFTLTAPADGSGGGRLQGEAVGALGRRERFEVVLRPGWCLLQSGAHVHGMAAVPDRTGCTVAVFSGPRVSGAEPPPHRHEPGAERCSALLLDRLARRLAARSVPGGPE
ncbi:hypothetical protein [Streptomyces sp. NPDC046939]|uniref:hypothetical protein n=1 Tax=Streptomyces sp. NPDC046939 TaxID=3155376 RepID=UPI0034105145